MNSNSQLLLNLPGSLMTNLLVRMHHWVGNRRERSAAPQHRSHSTISYDTAFAAYQRQDYATALAAFRQLAEQDNGQAQLRLAEMYDHGYGVTPDVFEAFRYYRDAAENGVAEAQYQLGLCYLYGYGVACDSSEAYVWFCRAAVQMHGSAMFNLGLMYQQGLGVPRDANEATLWFNRAAEWTDGLPH
jgi:TPR repeat protein